MIAPPGTATTAARLLDGTDVQVAWKYNRETRAWDRSYLPAIGFGGFDIAAGDALWVIAGSDQTLTVEGRPPPTAPPPRAITLAVREGSDLLVVPEGTPTTAAALFGGTDVQVVWKYHRAPRAWDQSYLPGPGFGGFDIAPGDGLWVDLAARADAGRGAGAGACQAPDRGPGGRAERERDPYLRPARVRRGALLGSERSRSDRRAAGAVPRRRRG